MFYAVVILLGGYDTNWTPKMDPQNEPQYGPQNGPPSGPPIADA